MTQIKLKVANRPTMTSHGDESFELGVPLSPKGKFMLRPVRTFRWLAAALLFTAAGAYAADTVVLYKRASCGCCGGWADHMRAAGFNVNITVVADPGEIRQRHGIPDVATCHTAVVNGYAIEGHVPAGEVKRLLAERPKARGLAVPRMPAGSPGMDQGGKVDPYDVFLVQDDGSFKVYARYGR